MAVPTGTFTGFSAIGEREDLADIVYDISPIDTPFMSNVARGTCDAVFTEWQTDSLASASADNAEIEGDDAATNTASPTVRLGNYAQLMDKVVQVSSTLRAVDTAGRRDEYSYQTAKRGRELKRDIESAVLSLNAATTGSAGTARKLAGVASWLWKNQVQQGQATTTPTVTSGAPTTAPTAGTTSTFTETNLKDAVKKCWDEGGNPTVVLLNSFNKQKASGFGGIATLYRDTQGRTPATVIGAADVYVSDFGEHQIVADRFMPAGNVYVLDLEYWEIAYLQPIQREGLAKTGHSDRGMIYTELTLCAKQPDSSAKVYTTTTS